MAALAGCGGGRAGGSEQPAGGPTLRLRVAAVDGGEIDTARYRGKVIVLHLFDTDATAAALDAEKLTRLAAAHRDQLMVVGICLDREGYPMAVAWRRALGVRYLIGLADEPLRAGRSPIGKLRMVPTTLVLDRGGHLVERIDRPLEPDEVEGLVGELIR
jgi:hypothetical protein